MPAGQVSPLCICKLHPPFAGSWGGCCDDARVETTSMANIAAVEVRYHIAKEKKQVNCKDCGDLWSLLDGYEKATALKE